MKIFHRGIQHNVATDAPFIGARLSAMYCDFKCPGCCNTHLINEPLYTNTVEELIAEVKNSNLDDGIIFGGLEWSFQMDELRAMVLAAIDADLKVMIFTRLPLYEFVRQAPWCLEQPIFIKCGDYRELEMGYYDSKNDVYLASKNQNVYNMNNIYAVEKDLICSR